MTEPRNAEQAALRKELIKEYCAALDDWSEIVIRQSGNVSGKDAFQANWSPIRLAISKSCLLDRTIYCGEKPSQTPCPVHKGAWAGCHSGWPGRTWRALVDHDGHKAGDVWLAAVEPFLRDWYDAGCRCAYHLCGCTTGWQPDEHCGCGGEERVRTEIAAHGLSY